MATIILAGWREGLQKVALANLQRDMLHLSLREAKENVDRLLEAEEGVVPANPVVLQVPDGAVTEFSNRANELGAFVGFVQFFTAQQPRLAASDPKPNKLDSQRSAA